VTVAKLAGAGLAVAALSACGSSHRVGLHDYSVQQVKRVFAAHGIPLRQARFGPATGVVELRNHKVEVDVVSAHTTEWGTVSSGDSRNRVRRNVIVTYPPSHARAVEAALRSLKA
jgi:hypothetical protein